MKECPVSSANSSHALKGGDFLAGFLKYPVKDCKELVDYYLARNQLTEQILRSNAGNVAYVCGLDHIFGDYQPNLFDRRNYYVE